MIVISSPYDFFMKYFSFPSSLVKGFLMLAAFLYTGKFSAQYSVGSSGPAGGIIIFEDVNDEFAGWDFLEVWPHTLGLFQTLACDHPPHLSSEVFGYGLENSEHFKLLDGSVNTFDFVGYFDGGGHQDWFIPSKGELEFLVSSEFFSMINGGEDVNVVSSSVHNGCNWWRYSTSYGWDIPDLWEWVDVLPMRRFSTDDSNSFCGEGTIWDEEAQLCVLDETQLLWQPDSNGDSVVGITDLLALLSIWGEQDVDNDGIYDSVDDCVGAYDECGVCNGGGPSVQILQGVTILYDSVYAEQVDQWFVFEVGVDSTFVYECQVFGCIDPEASNSDGYANTDDGSCVYGPPECGGASTITFNGSTYDLVAIGSQCWFAENLRTEHYANGDAIPGNLTDSEWTSTSSGAQTVYGDGSSLCGGDCDEVANLEAFGRLYNWYAVDDSRGLCPSGWHVPTDGEWMTLEMELGMSASDANSTGWRGTDQGAQMKPSSSDDPSWDGTNTSGFSALPGGWRRFYNGYFYDEGYNGYWWSASPNEWYRMLGFNVDDVYRDNGSPRNGFSIRCLRDE